MEGIAGINAYHGDASAAFLRDGRLVAAAEEERFNRVKHSAGFPAEALRYVTEAAGLGPADVRILAVARDPWARLLQKTRYALRLPFTAAERLKVHGKFASIASAAGRTLRVSPRQFKVYRVTHHLAHLASAFFVSPFDQAALFSIDGMGDFASAMWGVGRGNSIESYGSISFPHSLGIFYTALTQYLGFPKYGDEYKVMGLASYGQPEFIDEVRKMVVARNHGGIGFTLAPDYFLHHRHHSPMTWDGEPMIGRLYSDYLVDRLGPTRRPDEPLEQRHKNIASSTQTRLEEVVLEQLRSLRRATGLRKLCLAGGVAFNCVANGKIREQAGFDEVYIQCAAGDAGLAIGAATYVWHQVLGKPRDFVMEHAFWGPEYSQNEIRAALGARQAELDSAGCEVQAIGKEEDVYRLTAEQIAQGKVVGWFQGRMEWGPRALGNRSILADPRRPEMRNILNRKIKRREVFRPFAPSIIEEACSEYFTQSYPSPFMLMAYEVKNDKRPVIPATTHVDGTGRLQTVSERQNLSYYRLIREFGRQTGVPVLLNTSFNESEPLVRNPDEAIDCFLRTKMDALVMGNFITSRRDRS